MKIEWDSESTEILINPRLPEEDLKYVRLFQGHSLKGHLWFLTSGTTSSVFSYKWVALSKRAFLHSAEAVNAHLDISSKDRWLNVLPHFHVGGLSILARAWLSKSPVTHLKGKWDPTKFLEVLEKEQCTLTSIVPAQLYDLVRLQRNAPSSLRAIIVGGGALSAKLYHEAKMLKWPVVPTYGMTECASQIATGSLEVPSLIPLKHVQIRISKEGYLFLKSDALLTTYAFQNKNEIQWVDPKIEGWFKSEDKATFANGHLTICGRASDFIKIGGENVSFSKLEAIFEEIRLELKVPNKMLLIPVPDARLGTSIHLAYEGNITLNFEAVVNAFNERVMPFERIKKYHRVPKIPKTSLYKPFRNKILKMIQI